MKIYLEVDEKELRKLVLAHVRQTMGDVAVEEKDVEIQVKSTQNYKAEWEKAAFRAVVKKESASR